MQCKAQFLHMLWNKSWPGIVEIQPVMAGIWSAILQIRKYIDEVLLDSLHFSMWSEQGITQAIKSLNARINMLDAFTPG